MNPPGESHEIAPEFRARLEWQVESALRRETRFAEPPAGGASTPAGRPRRGRCASSSAASRLPRQASCRTQSSGTC